MVDVTITNPNFNQYYDEQNADNAAQQAQTLLWTVLFGAQLLIYYDLWKDVVDKRDAAIDEMEAVLEYLHETDLAVDYPMMQKKQGVLGLDVPSPDMCADAKDCAEDIMKDGAVVDALAASFANRDCCGIPQDKQGNDIVTTEGAIQASKAASYVGGVLANSGKRRQEQFRKNKTSLMLRAQATARMGIAPILAGFQQSMAIYESLAAIYLQGFNSAGAGLGVNLGQLAGASSGPVGAAAVDP